MRPEPEIHTKSVRIDPLFRLTLRSDFMKPDITASPRNLVVKYSNFVHCEPENRVESKIAYILNNINTNYFRDKTLKNQAFGKIGDFWNFVYEISGQA